VIGGRTPQAPSLPLSYLAAAAAAFVAAALAVPWLAAALAGHYYHPRVLALAHTVTLGWITMTIMGASYQLVPVLLERPVGSVRAARWQLAAFVVGVIGVVGHFALGEWKGFVWGAALVTVAALAHTANVGRGVLGAKPSFTRTMLLMSLGGLVATALFGTLLGVDRAWRVLPDGLFPRLHAHVHLALLGWVLPVVMGVAARVYPMFMLAPEPAGTGARVQVAGLGAGVPLVVLGLLMEAPAAVVAGAALVTAAIAAHLRWIYVVVRDGKRPALDWSLRFVLAGAIALVPAAALGIAQAVGLLAGPRVALAYGVLALGGWASLTIVGMLLKIVPFLVWYRVYGPRVGKEPVPTLAQLSCARAEAVAFTLLVAGVGTLALAVCAGDVIAIRVAGAVLAAGGVAFGATLARALRHLRGASRRPAASAAVLRTA
jgi:hypothetical protein